MAERTFWTQQEINILNELAGVEACLDDVLKVLPYRSRESIRLKLRAEGIVGIKGVNSVPPPPNLDALKQILKEGKKRCL